MKNKKGFLLAEETLKIILAVISIGFLIYFLTALYFANQNSEELEQAEASLEHLIEGINSMKEGDVRKVEIYNPEGWAISSWPYENDKPESCELNNWESCLCICKNPMMAFSSNFLDNCEDKSKGVCLENTEKLIVKEEGGSQSPIWIKNPPLKLNIDSLSKTIK